VSATNVKVERMKVGDTLWRATAGQREKWVPCDICAGERFVTLILGSGEHVRLDCGACSPGLDPPSGRQRVYEFDGRAEPYTITGIEVTSDSAGERVRYRSGTDTSYYTFNAEDCFPSAEAAQARCAELVAQHEAEEAGRRAKKEKPDKSYAWHASYHLREAKENRRKLAYHESKAVLMKAASRTPVTEAPPNA
jgi:hypothetical protein